MSVQPAPPAGVVIIEPTVFSDERGEFYESYNRLAFAEATGFDGDFVQDNQSRSKLGVVRGLHYQVPPYEQGKLVRCISGGAFDVAVDIRQDSPTFGGWIAEVLSADNRLQLWIPAGFAHGFMAMSDGAVVAYKTTGYWAPESERTIRWDDPAIGIDWPNIDGPILAEKDAAAPLLSEAEVFA